MKTLHFMSLTPITYVRFWGSLGSDKHKPHIDWATGVFWGGVQSVQLFVSSLP